MVLRLRARDRARLEQAVREQRGQARAYRRARMVLLASAGESVASIARQRGTSRARVTDRLRRFRSTSLDGLVDRPRSGRPRVLTAIERHQVAAAACQSPRTLGVDRDVWTHQALAGALVEAGLLRAISTNTVGDPIPNSRDCSRVQRSPGPDGAHPRPEPHPRPP